MPDALELPRVRRAVVPQVPVRGGRGATIHLPSLPPSFSRCAVVVALYDLSEPPARLRRIQTIRVSRRSLDVVDLPTGEVGTADVPAFAFSVRCQDERALSCANQQPYSAHALLLYEVTRSSRPTTLGLPDREEGRQGGMREGRALSS